MERTLPVFAIALASAIAVAIVTNQSLRAHESQTQVPNEKVTPLLKTPLNGVDGKEVNILHIAVSPGFQTSKHYHPGQLFIYVVEGAVTIELDGQPPVKFGPGDVFEEPPGKLMVGKNLSSTHGARLIVFQIGDKGKPLLIDKK